MCAECRRQQSAGVEASVQLIHCPGCKDADPLSTGSSTLLGARVTLTDTAATVSTGQVFVSCLFDNLETGHRVKTSAQCPCGEADQTPEHYLQSCSLHQQARQQIWPTCVSLKTKLWGSAEDLLLTSRYAALTGERI